MKKILLFILLTFILNTSTFANQIKCKKFDLKCKAKKFVDDTKDFQKKGLEQSKSKILKNKNQIKDKIKNVYQGKN